MTRIDRYVLVMFLRTMLICFLSIGGVFVLFHAFSHLDDLFQLAKESDSAVLALAGYYGPYMVMLFDWTGTIIAMVAMLFTVAWLRGSGELTSLLAAGINHGRIVRPILVAVAVVILVQTVCREWVIPAHREALTNKPRDLRSGLTRAILPSYDKSTGILIEGEGLFLGENRVERPSFRLYAAVGQYGDAIDGASAQWLAASDDRPPGYLVDQVTRPAEIDSLPAGTVNGREVILTNRSADWVGPGQCYVVTTIDPEVLLDNPRSTRLAGMGELMRRVRNGSVHSSMDVHVLLHERMLRPPLDFCLLLMGLPLVVNRDQRRLFAVIGRAIGIVLMFFALKTAATALAAGGYVLTPAMAAWSPLLLLGPIAVVRFRWSWDQ